MLTLPPPLSPPAPPPAPPILQFADCEDVGGQCPLCKGGILCELCHIKHTWEDELITIPRGPGGRLRRLKSLGDLVMNMPKPPLDYKPKPKKAYGLQAKLKRATSGGGRRKKGGKKDDMKYKEGDEEYYSDSDDARRPSRPVEEAYRLTCEALLEHFEQLPNSLQEELVRIDPNYWD